MPLISVYVTHQNEAAAEPIIRRLIDGRLAACVNSFAVASAYVWEGAMAREGELVTLFKAPARNWDAIRAAVEELHPYAVPCVLKFEIEANAAYAAWVEERCA